MSKSERDILLAKIDALKWSFSDTQMQAIMSILSEIVVHIPVDGEKELGFNSEKEKL